MMKNKHTHLDALSLEELRVELEEFDVGEDEIEALSKSDRLALLRSIWGAYRLCGHTC